MRVQLTSLTVETLKALLTQKNLETEGNKTELIARLQAVLQTDYVECAEENASVKTQMDVLKSEMTELKDLFKELVSNVKQIQDMGQKPAGKSVSHAQTSNNFIGSERENYHENISQHSGSQLAQSTTDIYRPYRANTVTSPYKNEEFKPSSHTPAIRDIADVLPEYDPVLPSSISVDQFVVRINNLISVYKWDQGALMLAVYTKLKGPAKLWLDACEEVHETWDSLSAQLISDFGVEENEADIHTKMSLCVRKPTERIVEYFYRLCSLGQRYRLSEAAIIKYARNGLKHNDLQNAIAGIQFNSTKEMRLTIERYLENRSVAASTSQRNYAKVSNEKFQHDRSASYYPNQTISKPRHPQPVTTVRQNSAGILCYNCHDTGHISLKCPKPQRKPRCNRCLRTTHTTTECPEQHPNVSSRDNVLLISDKAVNISSPLTKEITINGIKLTAFIDPGSDRSLIKDSISRKIGPVLQAEPHGLKGFGGGYYTTDFEVNGKVQMDDKIFDVELLVVSDLMIPESVLLGSDVLCRAGHRLIIENGTCHLEELKLDDVHTDQNLSHADKQDLMKVISTYSDCFGENLRHLGKCNTTTMHIKLTSEKPVVKNPYRIPFAKRAAVDKIIRELLDLDIIRQSSSSYSSPIVLVKKQNGEDRMCIDFRELNAITEKVPWPMPTVEEILSTLSGKKYFTTVDLMSGYYQIQIEESARHFTGFVTHNGHYEFNRMPFGLVNAPYVFQSMIVDLIRPMQQKAISYVDEVILPSMTVEEGLNVLKEFLELVRNAGLTLRLSKCVFLATEIKFLGHRVDRDGLKPGQEKIAAVYNFPTPTNATEVRRFLGLTGFFRKFVKDYAAIAKPLTQLLRTKTGADKFSWTPECTVAFDRLKSILCEEPVLEIYDPGKEHEIHTDASCVGLAGILLQQSDSKLKPVAYYSRLCTDSEAKFHSHELEVLAIVESLQRFRMYVLGKHFNVVTDCEAVSTTKMTKPLPPRISRWWLKLSEYNFTIIHRAGIRMQHVDALSRAPVDAANETADVSEKILKIDVTVLDWLYTMQMQDPKLAEIIRVLKKEITSDQYSQIKTDYTINRHRLFRKVGDELKFVVPSGVRWRIVRLCHDENGHSSLEQTIRKIQETFWFPRMRNYVKAYLNSCIECCYNKRPAGSPEGRLYGMEIPSVPFQTLHMDHLGPFPKSRKGNFYILGIIDALTKYTIIAAVKSTKTAPVIQVLNALTTYFGLPVTIITDRGTAFTSSSFKNYCDEHDIKHIKVAVRTPRGNGQIERVNQSILTYLRTTTVHPADWDQHIRHLQWTLNTHRNSTTGFSPVDLVFDFKLRDITANKMLLALTDGNDNADTSVANLHERRTEALNNINAAREKWKQRFDRKHKVPYCFKEGELVVVENVPNATGESKKMEPKYRGPYIVSKVLRFDRYLIEDINEAQRKQRPFSSVFTSDKLKPWCVLTPEFDPDIDEIETISQQEWPSCHANEK